MYSCQTSYPHVSRRLAEIFEDVCIQSGGVAGGVVVGGLCGRPGGQSLRGGKMGGKINILKEKLGFT
jgi:hypothetical protein